jgi:hypothetical protein
VLPTSPRPQGRERGGAGGSERETERQTETERERQRRSTSRVPRPTARLVHGEREWTRRRWRDHTLGLIAAQRSIARACASPRHSDASACCPQGRATVRFRGGAVYDGAFAGGRMHDPAGRAVFPSGSVWRGGFDRGRWGP